MSKRDALMFAIYLVVVALGIHIMERQPILGMTQVIFGAAIFGFRLYLIFEQRR